MITEKTLEELREELTESLEGSIRILQSILDDVKNGIYGPEQAQMDHENLMFNDGINFMSVIEEIAEMDV
jgi:DNA relaxase NicK